MRYRAEHVGEIIGGRAITEHACYVDESMICPDIATYNYNWPFIRLSYKFAYGILHEMEHGQVRGMHETIVAAYIASRNLKVGFIPEQFHGKISLGSWGKYKETKYQKLEAMNATKNKLYHPVKCKAYGNGNVETMKQLIQEWC